MPPVTYTTAVAKARSVKIWMMAWSLYSSHKESRTTKKTNTVYQTRTTLMNRRVETLFGVRLTINNSTASRNEMMTTRTLTSHASHERSLNLVPISACLSQCHKWRTRSTCQLSDHRKHRQVQ